MAGNRQPPSDGRPELQSLQRGRLRGWRASALVIGAVVVALIYVARFGLPDLASPAASPGPSATAVAAPSPTGMPTEAVDPTATPDFTPPVVPPPRGRPDGPLRYHDGLPMWVDGQPVGRVEDFGHRPPPDEVLVGGWYSAAKAVQFSDAADLAGGGLRLVVEGNRPGSDGPVILRGQVRLSECAANQRAAGSLELDLERCPHVIQASETVWSGDAFTDAVPIGAAPLLGALGEAFDQVREPLPLRREIVALFGCQPAWPLHTYVADRGPVRLALVFPTPNDRLMAESGITQSAWFRNPPPEGDCAAPQLAIDGRTRWLVDGNVMLLIRSNQQNNALVRDALAQARAASEGYEPVWRPVTTWQTLRALWQLDPTIDLLPAYESLVCADVMPEQAHSVRHDQLRMFAVFDSRAEREEFEESTAAASLRYERGACQGLGGRRPIEADARWVSVENIMLLVVGPGEVDERLRQSIPRSRSPW